MLTFGQRIHHVSNVETRQTYGDGGAGKNASDPLAQPPAIEKIDVLAAKPPG
jgi:hypothetical protein